MQTPTIPTSQSFQVPSRQPPGVRLDPSREFDQPPSESLLDQSMTSLRSDLNHSDRRPILKHRGLEASPLCPGQNNRKNIHFAQTEVHLVENWKSFNRPRKTCCFGCF